MLEKGDLVVFKSESNNMVYECQSDQFRFYCIDVVMLYGYDGELNVKFLEKGGILNE